ncbi:Uncharacterised protein [uncultured archaeon]|nr:Uncharacterised protein [uncultured archaeon]
MKFTLINSRKPGKIGKLNFYSLTNGDKLVLFSNKHDPSEVIDFINEFSGHLNASKNIRAISDAKLIEKMEERGLFLRTISKNVLPKTNSLSDEARRLFELKEKLGEHNHLKAETPVAVHLDSKGEGYLVTDFISGKFRRFPRVGRQETNKLLEDFVGKKVYSKLVEANLVLRDVQVIENPLGTYFIDAEKWEKKK